MNSFSLSAKIFIVVGAMSLSCILCAYFGMSGFSATTVVGAVVTSILFGAGLAFYTVSHIRQSIDHVVENLARNSDSVEHSSRQVSDSANKLSQSATEQAASLQQTAASAQQLTGMVQRNRETAGRANEISSVSLASAQKGKRVVEEMTHAIAEIDSSNQTIMNQVNESNRQISEITKVIAEIGNKTKVINDIVFQTKLLSFNASVEAARAGEHGKGFAVVAEEVGNLAAMSGTAAKEISEMLDSSILKVETIVNDTKTSVGKLVSLGKEKVEAGARIAQQCSDVLDEIVGNVGEVSRMSTDIAGASQEQATGVSEIGRAMQQLDHVTQTNASAAELAANAAASLSSQSASMKTMVQQLLASVYGGSSSSHGDYQASAPVRQASVAPAKRAAPVAPKKEVAKAAAPVAPAAPKAAAKKAAAPAKPVAKSNVTPLAPKRTSGKDNGPRAIKLAAGAEIEIPSEDDPRFKDV